MPNQTSRRYYLDWLRILATLLLIPYHTARIFDTAPYYLKNETTYLGFGIVLGFIDLWFMPLFFFVAGAVAKYSLENRSKTQYIWERFKRLLLPFLFGIFIFIPPITYYGFLFHNPNIDLSYYQYYPLFFKFSYKNIDGYRGGFTPSHLWFILYLFGFSWITFPLFRFFKTQSSQEVIEQLGIFLLNKPIYLFICVFPLSLARIILLPYYNPFYYILFYIYGYLFILNESLKKVAQKNYFIALTLGIILVVYYFWMENDIFPLSFGLNITNLINQILLSLNSFCWLIVILYIAQKYLNINNSARKYLSHASSSIYILHMTWVISTGFYVIQWQQGIICKFLVIILMSSIGTLSSYELIKNNFIARLFLGIKSLN